MTGRRDTGRVPALPAKLAILAIGLCLALAGCRQNMHNQAKYKTYSENDFFADGQTARVPPANTVARGDLRESPELYTGMTRAGQLVAEMPMPVTAQLLRRGQERFNIFCSPCHDRVGNGNGIIVQRGYKQPPSLHVDRLRASPPGYFFTVITNGFATMPSYAAQIPVADRWAIVGYIRALQLSQHAKLADVPSGDRARLEGGTVAPPTPAPRGGHHGDGDA